MELLEKVIPNICLPTLIRDKSIKTSIRGENITLALDTENQITITGEKDNISIDFEIFVRYLDESCLKTYARITLKIIDRLNQISII